MSPRYLLVLASAYALSACGGDDGIVDQETECKSNLLAGDLVITEVFANPDGDDEGNEYFEIYNATGEAIDLTGLLLEKSAVDGSKTANHRMRETVIEPGSYLALGGVAQEFRAPYIGYGYADDLGTMTNAGGQLSLICGDVQVDHMFYGEAESGKSQGLDGNITPNHTANDNLENFCHATTEFANGVFGSPGVGNEPCSIVEQTTCLDGGTMRDVVKPTAGQLVISEFMADSSAVGDEVGEWFEVVAKGEFDLNGLVGGKTLDDPKFNIVDENCIKMSDGQRLLFARSTDSSVNGGLPAPDYTYSFGLSNGGSTIAIGVGDTLIDQIEYTGSSTGKSTSLDPASETAEANDNEENWCDGQLAYGDGDLGTPGAANPPCDTSGMCMGENGLRPTVAPTASDVQIAEFMPNPAATSDTVGEWFEVRFASAVDLNGVGVGKNLEPELDVEETIDSLNCVSVEAGTSVIFARNTDSNANGGLPSENIFPSGFSLGQSSGSHTIFVSLDGQVLDSVTYEGSEISAGESRQIDSNGDRCNGSSPYGAGDLGSPGADNPDCP